MFLFSYAGTNALGLPAIIGATGNALLCQSTLAHRLQQTMLPHGVYRNLLQGNLLIY